MIEILVPISNDFQWELKPFFHFFDKHWSPDQPVTVLTAKDPGLPRANYVPVRTGMVEDDWHFGFFSNGLIEFLKHDCETPLVLLMQADYWLSEPVDVETIEVLTDYMQAHPKVTRMAISIVSRDAVPLEKLKNVTVMHCPEEHRPCFFPMSLLPAIWNKERWLKVLGNGWNPWEFETKGDDAYRADPDMLSLTTDRPPLDYFHAAKTRSKGVLRKGIPEEDWEAVKPMIPKGFAIL